MKKIVLVLLFIIISGAIVGYYYFNKPAEAVADKDAVAAFSSVALFNYFTENEEEANTKFAGKVLEVKGPLVDILQNDDSSTSVILGSDDMMFGIKGKLIPNAGNLNFKRGDTITIKGFCSGMNTDVELNKCVIVRK